MSDPVNNGVKPAAPGGRRAWLCIGLPIAAVQVAYAAWRALSVPPSADLVCFHRTCLYWWRTGAFTDALGVRQYLPAFVVLAAPFLAWPLWLVAPAWAILNITLLMLTVRHVSRIAAGPDAAKMPDGLYWAWPIVLVLPFASSTITQGQVNIVVLWLCVTAYVAAMRGRDTAAGLLIAVAGIVKIYPVLFILYWLVKRRFRPAVTAGAACLGGAAILSLCGFGWRGSLEAHRIWLGQLCGIESAQVHRGSSAPATPGNIPFSEARNEYHRYNNQSLAVVVRRLTTSLYPAGDPRRVNLLDLSPRASAWLYGASAGGLLVGLAVLAWRRRDRCDFEEWAAWLAAVIAFVPIYWTHYFVLALPVLTIMSFRVWQGRQTGRPEHAATILQACWLVALVLLAVPAAREVGAHCWIVLAATLWVVLRPGSMPAPALAAVSVRGR